MTAPRYLTQAAYARLRGVAKSHIKQTGRLLITPAGLVDVAASDALSGFIEPGGRPLALSDDPLNAALRGRMGRDGVHNDNV